jgi:outer membrane beta-barrel protein
LLLGALICLPSVGMAQSDDDRKVSVIQQKPFLRAMRAELTGSFGYTVNETLNEFLQAAGGLRFHITDSWSIGTSYSHYFATDKATVGQLQNEFGVFPERSTVQWFAGGDVSWVPVYGKFVLFESGIIHWDMFLSAGAGVTKTWEPAPLVTGTAGLGTRIYLTRWLTLTIELKDHIYLQAFKAGDKIMNNLVVHSGLSIFIPFGWEYEFQR